MKQNQYVVVAARNPLHADTATRQTFSFEIKPSWPRSEQRAHGGKDQNLIKTLSVKPALAPGPLQAITQLVQTATSSWLRIASVRLPPW
jgi:hypothetical protein